MELFDPVKHLYMHVPFCAHKCEYCAFYSHLPQAELVVRYASALLKELEWAAPHLRPQTVFFGGGTPSLLPIRVWQQVLEGIERLGLLGANEWTVECNPATVSLEKAKLLRSFGVNRISMGVQSLDERLLERLGRIHSREMVFKSYDILRRAGFENVNIDLMFGIPGQTMVIWQQTLQEALALQSEHLSSYEVIYEEDTPLFEQMRAGEFDVDEELACDMYDALVEAAGAGGFEQYEVANFAQGATGIPGRIPGRACQHNVNYWRGGAFYGLGPSASGFVGGVRSRNIANTTIYCERLESGQRPLEGEDVLAPRARAGEIAAFGLRMNIGWPFRQYENVTGFDLRREWGVEVQQLVEEGLAMADGERVWLTRRGLRLADAVGERFLVAAE